MREVYLVQEGGVTYLIVWVEKVMRMLAIAIVDNIFHTAREAWCRQATVVISKYGSVVCGEYGVVWAEEFEC